MRAPDGPAGGASVAKSFVELVDPLGHGDVAPILLGSAVRGGFLGGYRLGRLSLGGDRVGRGLDAIRPCGGGRPLAPVLASPWATSPPFLVHTCGAVFWQPLNRC